MTVLFFAEPDQDMYLFTKFLEGIKSRPWLRNSRIILFTEMNTGKEGGHFAAIGTKFTNVYPVAQKERGRYGWWTGKEKPTYGTRLRDEMASKSLLIYEDLVCENPYLGEDRIRETLDLLKEQFLRARFYVEQPTNVFGPVRTTFSAKVGPRGNQDFTKTDDMAVAIGFNLYVSKLFYERAECMTSCIDYASLCF
jgi:hypothetical protein